MRLPIEILIRLIVSIVVVVALVVILIKYRDDHDMTVYPDSLEVMRQRYERGEISKEDYEEQKRRRGKD
jgi:putative membrane protein